MKTKEEIEQLAFKSYGDTLLKGSFIHGYTQCQDDTADKKYTKEDVIHLMFNASHWDTFKEGEVGYDMSLSEYIQHCLQILNK